MYLDGSNTGASGSGSKQMALAANVADTERHACRNADRQTLAGRQDAETRDAATQSTSASRHTHRQMWMPAAFAAAAAGIGQAPGGAAVKSRSTEGPAQTATWLPSAVRVQRAPNVAR